MQALSRVIPLPPEHTHFHCPLPGRRSYPFHCMSPKSSFGNNSFVARRVHCTFSNAFTHVSAFLSFFWPACIIWTFKPFITHETLRLLHSYFSLPFSHSTSHPLLTVFNSSIGPFFKTFSPAYYSILPVYLIYPFLFCHYKQYLLSSSHTVSILQPPPQLVHRISEPHFHLEP